MTLALVILPTYNEASNIPGLIEQIMASAVRADVLVVDDDSPDGTADVAAVIGESCPGRVHVLRRQVKEGLGPAYRAGISWALARDYTIIVQMDADGSHPADVLPAMVRDVQGGADMVIGSRYVAGGGTRNWPLHRRILSRFGNGYARVLLGLPVNDVTSGFRCWRREALEQIATIEFAASGYSYLIEMLLGAQRLAFRVSEVPIIFKNREKGKSKMSVGIGIEAMQVVLRLRKFQLGQPCPGDHPSEQRELGETAAAHL